MLGYGDVYVQGEDRLAKALSREQLMMYARAGAQARIAELRAELASLEGAFRGAERPGGRAGTRVASEVRRRKLSAAGRKKIADAAKRRWAQWRKAKGKN